MAEYGSLLLYILTCILTLNNSILCIATGNERKVYIVYMGSLPKGEYSPTAHHRSLLQEMDENSSWENRLLRSYGRSFNGFAAKLSSHEAQKLASMNHVVSIFPSRTFQLQTTRSWDFMGFHENTRRNATAESDTIVAVFDSGIWPESESFNDEGFGPPPKKWKGACKGGQNFTCNNKIIGARYYSSSSHSQSARDDVGHGTHTASIAAGNIVKDVGFYGLAQGTARGGVPSARIAAYKICSASACESSDILAAFDDAIADEVDIITISMASATTSSFDGDPIAIGAFHAMEKGVLTLQSVGNSGPELTTVSSVAPWLLSVAASSTDRRIIDEVILGRRKTIVGTSVNSFTLKRKKFRLIYGKNASHKCNDLEARLCNYGCLDHSLAKGKIVLCDSFYGNVEAKRAGALGSILSSDVVDVSQVVPFPALALSSKNYDAVKSYMNSTKKPFANILKSKVIKDFAAPAVASFSSRGPNPMVPDIMKPDVTAPGVEILAAHVPVVPPSESPEDKRLVKYNIRSGTSMACPHAAGLAAHVKTSHPDWSPSAIKSAIMTTAWIMNATTNSGAEFAYGSGHINPVKAIDPGLVYEALKGDYIKLLCGMGYNVETIQRISGDHSTCSNGYDKTLPKDFNYPSMTVKVLPGQSFKIEFHRTVTNVGFANSTYKAEVFPNSALKIKVVPEVISFNCLNERMSFDVTVVGGILSQGTFLSSALVWSDGYHDVRSPIVVHTFLIS